MTAASSSAREIALERPQIRVAASAAGHTVVQFQGVFGAFSAWLTAAQRRLLVASLRHVMDSRTLGGLTVTIDLDVSPDHPPRRASAVLISSDGASLVLALLGFDDQVLAASRLDQATIDILQGEPG